MILISIQCFSFICTNNYTLLLRNLYFLKYKTVTTTTRYNEIFKRYDFVRNSDCLRFCICTSVGRRRVRRNGDIKNENRPLDDVSSYVCMYTYLRYAKKSKRNAKRVPFGCLPRRIFSARPRIRGITFSE